MVRIRITSQPAILVLAGAALFSIPPVTGQTAPAPKNWTTIAT